MYFFPFISLPWQIPTKQPIFNAHLLFFLLLLHQHVQHLIVLLLRIHTILALLLPHHPIELFIDEFLLHSFEDLLFVLFSAFGVHFECAAAEVAARLTGFGQGPDRFGLIHADLRMSNLMIDPSSQCSAITVIDFDDCGWSWHLADLGAVVSFIEDTAEAEQMIADWLRGYREVRAIPVDHLDMIATFVMLRRLTLTAWVASHADADAAIAFTGGFSMGTVELAQRYLRDRGWMRYE